MLAAVVLLFLSLVLQCDQWRRVTGFTFPACPTCSSFTGERWHYSPFRRRKPVAKATATSSLRHWRDTSSSPSSSSSSSWRLFALPKDFDPYKGMDAYQILEVPRNADDAAIKKAFKKQIFKWHPDRVPREEEDRKEEHEIRTAKINHAYWCLKDPERKSRYDKYGEDGVGQSEASEQQKKAAGGPIPQGFGGPEGFEGMEIGDVGDLFEAFFGGGARQAGGGNPFFRGEAAPNPFSSSPFGGGGRGGPGGRASGGVGGGEEAEDLLVDLNLPFLTALFGGTQRLSVRRWDPCGSCDGSGSKAGGSGGIGGRGRGCVSCGGRGQVTRVANTPFGSIQSLAACPTCRGTGRDPSDNCPACQGKGLSQGVGEVEIRIPSGVESGATLRVREAGHSKRGAARRGDLFVKVRVESHPKFQREGTTILSEEEVSYTQAILGTVIKAETVEGMAEIRIPPGTQPGQKLRIRGKGAPRLGSSERGDLIITMKVRLPTPAQLSDKERELIQQLAVLSAKSSQTPPNPSKRP